jgi:nucleolin
MSDRIEPASSSGIVPRQTRLQSASQALTATDVKNAIDEAWIGYNQHIKETYRSVDSGVKSLREEVSSLAKEIRLHLIDLSKRMDVLEEESSDEQTDATNTQQHEGTGSVEIVEEPTPVHPTKKEETEANEDTHEVKSAGRRNRSHGRTAQANTTKNTKNPKNTKTTEDEDNPDQGSGQKSKHTKTSRAKKSTASKKNSKGSSDPSDSSSSDEDYKKRPSKGRHGNTTDSDQSSEADSTDSESEDEPGPKLKGVSETKARNAALRTVLSYRTYRLKNLSQRFS